MVTRRWSGFDVPDDDITNITSRGIPAVLQQTEKSTPDQDAGGRPMTSDETVIKENPGQAINVCQRIAMMPDFIDNIKHDALAKVPVSMPQSVGSLGFDTPLWVGLGIVGLWAALDAFAERAKLKEVKCDICGGMRCISSRFAAYTQGDEGKSLQELEDLRHLYAHNYAGDADEQYFCFRKRHVLKKDVETKLTCGASFNGRHASLDLPHLRKYSDTVKGVLERIS